MIQVPFPKTQPEMQAKNSNGSATKTVGTPPILKTNKPSSCSILHQGKTKIRTTILI